MVHVCNSRCWKVDGGEYSVQGHLQLQSEFKARLGYLRVFFGGGREVGREGGRIKEKRKRKKIE